MQVCIHCKEEKPLDRFSIRKNPEGELVYYGTCRECRNRSHAKKLTKQRARRRFRDAADQINGFVLADLLEKDPSLLTYIHERYGDEYERLVVEHWERSRLEIQGNIRRHGHRRKNLVDFDEIFEEIEQEMDHPVLNLIRDRRERLEAKWRRLRKAATDSYHLSGGPGEKR